jgi:YYY domain-containing protein
METARQHSGQRSTEVHVPPGNPESIPTVDDAQSHKEIEMAAETATAGSNPNTPVTSTVALTFVERFWKLALIVILILAVAFRTRGLNWDEGQHLHPDERFLTMVETAIELPVSVRQYFDTAQSPLNPYNNEFGSFVYGTAPLFFVRLIGEVVGLTEYANIVLLGRALSALADVFVVAMVFLIGRRLYGLRAGLLAALFYTLSVLPIKQSHFFTVDTFTNVPLMIAFWFALDVADGKRGTRPFILAGAFFGLMLASRINLAPFVGIIGLAAILRLAKSLENIQQMNVRLESRGEKQDPVRVGTPVTPEALPMRTFRIGPLLIEIEFKPAVPVQSGMSENASSKFSLGIWSHARPIILGMVLAGVAAGIAFRIAQPYAFDGFLSLNPQFLEDLSKAQRVVSGEDDYPPSHQWTNRTPYWFPWYNMVFWGFGPALGLAAWLGVGWAVYQVLRHRRWDHLLILFWVLGMFLYHGGQFVKTMRYFLPLYPFLTIFAAFFLFEMWNQAKGLAGHVHSIRMGKQAQFFAGLAFVIVLSTTVFWAAASTSIYTMTNTRVAASRWIYANVSDTELIGSEHWDDILPLRVDGKDYYRDHEAVILELYGEDTPEKREKMVEWMDQADYIILSSNRLYGSIPRLPMRFPLTTKYYEWLFNGQLGFEPVQEFTSYPQFMGITIIDDHAEEAFTVYDHPKVTIFKKTAAYSHANTVELFNSVDLTEVLRLKPVDATASRRQFHMTPAELAANRAGGTWTDIFNPNDMANRVPVLLWIVIVWGIGALAFPFTFVVFRGFADRGYAFAKALGILFVAWFAWLLSSYHILPFGRMPLLLGLLLMFLGGLLIVKRRWQEMRSFIKMSLTILLIEELVFFVCFALDLAIRFQNPDLWHPWMGGERPMDVAFLNAILKTTYLPPYNPWFAGSYINYYYFGQFISAALIRLSGIVPEVAYNLLIPMFFGLTASGAFGVVFNLVLSGRHRLKSNTQPAGGKADSGMLWPSVAGIFGVLLVLVIGNLGEVKLAVKGLTELGGGSGLRALINGLNKWILDGESIPVRIGDWYWTATRVIPDTINEFPFFTFIYGDLHAHLIAIPFTLVALGLAVHLLVSRAAIKWYDIGVIALVVGSLRAINTWDYPTYLGITGAAMLLRWTFALRESPQIEPLAWQDLLQLCLRSLALLLVLVVMLLVPLSIFGVNAYMELAIYLVLLLFGIGFSFYQAGKFWNPYELLRTFSWQFLSLFVLTLLFFAPYILNYATGYTDVEVWKDVRTTLGEYITVHGIFMFLVATVFVVSLFHLHSSQSDVELTGWTMYLVPLVIAVDLALVFLKLPVLVFVLPLISLGVWVLFHQRTSMEMVWVALLVLVSLVLTLLVEFVVLKGDIGRSNTVFKFYLQAWVLFGVASAAGLGLIRENLALASRADSSSLVPTPIHEKPVAAISSPTASSGSALRPIGWVWRGAFILLILAGLVYPIVAGWAKMNDRYVSNSPTGLNGMNYMRRATYDENNQQLILRWDYDAIQWMRQNIEGSPVIMEANTGLYRWGNRYSIYTGLPTVIGWDWHTKQQYSLLPGDLIDYRIGLVKEFYNTPDPERAMEIASRYDVSYVIIGGLERAVYDPNGLNKFEGMAQAGMLLKVYDANKVQIFQVLSTESAFSNK